MPPITLKTKVSWFLVQMPLADHCREVVSLAKHLGDHTAPFSPVVTTSINILLSDLWLGLWASRPGAAQQRQPRWTLVYVGLAAFTLAASVSVR